MATDQIQEPPAREAFVSPAGHYEFRIEMNGEATEWSTSGSTASLYRQDEGETALLWTRRLPHAYRPRFAVVSDSGEVILLDQWINVAGPHAVTALDGSGATTASYSFSDVAEVLGVPGREIVPLARFGAWMSATPQLAADQDAICVASGGRHLVIEFATGRLSSRGN